jgi:hypothetical protein
VAGQRQAGLLTDDVEHPLKRDEARRTAGLVGTFLPEGRYCSANQSVEPSNGAGPLPIGG